MLNMAGPNPFRTGDLRTGDPLTTRISDVDEAIELKTESNWLTKAVMRIKKTRAAEGEVEVSFPGHKVVSNVVQTNLVVAMNINALENITVKGDVICTNADCAEEFDVISNEVDAGTVMVLNHEGMLEPSSCAYDKRVAGVVSGAGDLRPGIILDKHKEENGITSRILIALMGKVNCKVDANYSSVEIGDLLTASPTHGHAMKAVDPLKAWYSHR
jgi:hypothetical protein